MTEDVKIRVTADADQMVAELANATRALKQMTASAQRTASSTNKAVKSIEFQTLGRNALEAAHKIGEMARATYQLATAWRDAHRDLGTGSEGVRALSSQVTEAEESIRQMTDIAGTMSAAFVSALEPALKGARVAMGGFAALTLRAGVEMARLRDTIVDSLIAVYDQDLGVKAANVTLEDYRQGLANIDDLVSSWTTSTEAQAEAQEQATAGTRRQVEAIRDLTRETERNRKAAIDAANAAAITASVTQKQADAEGRAKIEAATQAAREAAAIEVATAQQANAQMAADRKSHLKTVLDLTGIATQQLVGLMKDGSKEQAAAAKLAAAFQAAVNTGAAITQALTLPFPANIAAAGVVGALGIAQQMKIANEPMPSFDRGGVVDGGPQYPGGRPGQRLAQVEDGEMVLTRKMQEAMGQQGPQTVILRVGSREFGRAVIDSGATDGLQRRRGVGQRRYGG